MRIGIYSGTFDPVHKGHVAFALAAIEKAQLDTVYFAPEIKPRRKQHCTHIAHRIAMLRLAVRLHPKLEVLELPDANFAPQKTYARLRALFPTDEIVLLVGEDLLEHMHLWPYVDQLLPNIELAIGYRKAHSKESLTNLMQKLPTQPKDYYFVTTQYGGISSMTIRQDLINKKRSQDILKSIANYANNEWLYHDLSKD